MPTGINPRPTIEEIEGAVESLAASGLVKFFPSDERTVQIIMHELQRMVPTKAALDWLVEQYIRHIGEWHSLKELRAVLCARCEPLDGVVVTSGIPGYTPDELEAAAERAHLEQRDAEWKQVIGQKQLAEPKDPAFEAEMREAIADLQQRFRANKQGVAGRIVTENHPFARHIDNCPINVVSADGGIFGRCWLRLNRDHQCPIHGDVSREREHYRSTARYTRADQRLI